jgi:hypothetical protein
MSVGQMQALAMIVVHFGAASRRGRVLLRMVSKVGGNGGGRSSLIDVHICQLLLCLIFFFGDCKTYWDGCISHADG